MVSTIQTTHQWLIRTLMQTNGAWLCPLAMPSSLHAGLGMKAGVIRWEGCVIHPGTNCVVNQDESLMCEGGGKRVKRVNMCVGVTFVWCVYICGVCICV